MIRYGIKFIDNLVTDALVSIIKNIIQKCVRCFKHKPSDSSEVELFACAGMFWHAAKLKTQNNAATTNISFSIVFTIFLFFSFQFQWNLINLNCLHNLTVVVQRTKTKCWTVRTSTLLLLFAKHPQNAFNIECINTPNMIW